MADINTELIIGVSLSFLNSVAMDDDPDNLPETGQAGNSITG